MDEFAKQQGVCWDDAARRDEERWSHIKDSLDLLFARVGDISKVQEQMTVIQDLGAKVMEQVLKDQAKLSQQIENTGKAVAQLTLDRTRQEDMDDVPDGTGTHNYSQHNWSHRQHQSAEAYAQPYGAVGNHGSGDNVSGYKNVVPKLSFPEFSGRDPKVWRHKCEDFFHIYNVPEYLWITTATMHMKDNAGRWVEVQRLKGELDT